MRVDDKDQTIRKNLKRKRSKDYKGFITNIKNQNI